MTTAVQIPTTKVERELIRRRAGRHEFTDRREIRWRLMGVSERMRSAHPNAAPMRGGVA